MRDKIITAIAVTLIVMVGYQSYKIYDLTRRVNSKSEEIITIDLSKIIKEMTVHLVRQGLTDQQLAYETTAALKKIDEVVVAYKSQGFVILDKKAVITGVEDISDDIRNAIFKDQNINAGNSNNTIKKGKK
jgi:hypothetical protein